MSLIQVTQRKSRNGSDKRQLATLRSLGLRRIGQTVELAFDTTKLAVFDADSGVNLTVPPPE